MVEYKTNEECYTKYKLTFKHSENFIDTCSDKENHIISIKGEYTGDFTNSIMFVSNFLVDNAEYVENICIL